MHSCTLALGKSPQFIAVHGRFGLLAFLAVQELQDKLLHIPAPSDRLEVAAIRLYLLWPRAPAVALRLSCPPACCAPSCGSFCGRYSNFCQTGGSCASCGTQSSCNSARRLVIRRLPWQREREPVGRRAGVLEAREGDLTFREGDLTFREGDFTFRG